MCSYEILFLERLPLTGGLFRSRKWRATHRHSDMIQIQPNVFL